MVYVKYRLNNENAILALAAMHKGTGLYYDRKLHGIKFVSIVDNVNDIFVTGITDNEYNVLLDRVIEGRNIDLTITSIAIHIGVYELYSDGYTIINCDSGGK